MKFLEEYVKRGGDKNLAGRQRFLLEVQEGKIEPKVIEVESKGNAQLFEALCVGLLRQRRYIEAFGMATKMMENESSFLPGRDGIGGDFCGARQL